MASLRDRLLRAAVVRVVWRTVHQPSSTLDDRRRGASVHLHVGGIERTTLPVHGTFKQAQRVAVPLGEQGQPRIDTLVR